MEGDGVSEESDFVCIVLRIGIAYWPQLFPCGRTAAAIPLWKNSSYWIAWCFPTKPNEHWCLPPQMGPWACPDHDNNIYVGSSDFSREVLTFMKISSDFNREVLTFMKISSQKHWVYDTS